MQKPCRKILLQMHQIDSKVIFLRSVLGIYLELTYGEKFINFTNLYSTAVPLELRHEG